MFFRRPPYRKFEYLPRFYEPDKDPAEKFKRRFETERRAHRKKPRPVIVWGVIFAIIIYVYLFLSGVLR
ncbi:MAG: hypothetical protein HYW57_07335 [Ignavibacteriales bacterium]|nr:hypothetical protein [Ignavibacteriales bacterium]